MVEAAFSEVCAKLTDFFMENQSFEVHLKLKLQSFFCRIEKRFKIISIVPRRCEPRQNWSGKKRLKL